MTYPRTSAKQTETKYVHPNNERIDLALALDSDSDSDGDGKDGVDAAAPRDCKRTVSPSPSSSSTTWSSDQDVLLLHSILLSILQHRRDLYSLPDLAPWSGNGGSAINQKVRKLVDRWAKNGGIQGGVHRLIKEMTGEKGEVGEQEHKPKQGGMRGEKRKAGTSAVFAQGQEQTEGARKKQKGKDVKAGRRQ